MMRAFIALASVVLAAGLGGCAVFTVVDTAASVTGKVVEAGVDVATAPVDLIVGDDDADEKEND